LYVVGSAQVRRSQVDGLLEKGQVALAALRAHSGRADTLNASPKEFAAEAADRVHLAGLVAHYAGDALNLEPGSEAARKLREDADRETRHAEANLTAYDARLIVDRIVDRIEALTRSGGSASDAEIRSMERELRHALELSDQAIKTDRESAPAWTQRIRALHYLGKPGDAESALNQALARFPSDEYLNRLKALIRS